MQSVSDAYTPYSDERWSDFRVTFELIDVDAAEGAVPVATSEAAISQLQQTHNRITDMSNKIATLEHNFFVLDDSFIFPNENDNGETGWWSDEISGSDGLFSKQQVLEFSFLETQSSVGFTIVFDNKSGEYASDFTVQVYDSNGTLIDEEKITGNSEVEYVCNMPVDGYSVVKILFLKTSLPYRHVRVCEVIFGIIQTFTKNNSTKLKLLYEISPTMNNLPTDELSITIENADRKYNMINPKGIYKYLQEGQKMSVEFGIGSKKDSLEYINMGSFYFANASAEDDAMTAQITAYDKFYALDRGLYRRGTNETGTVSSIVNDIILDSGLNLSISVTEEVASRVIGKNIPIVTHREALRMVAQAARCSCYIDRNGVLTFKELVLSESIDTLNNNNLYQPAKVDVDEYINTVETKAISLGIASRDAAEIFTGTISIYGTKEIWITYNAAQITTTTITGGTIDSVDYYLYACRMTITAAADVTLTLKGNNIDSYETLFSAQNLEGNPESIITVDNPLIRADFAQDFAEWMLSTIQKRVSYSLSERANPAREIGDTIKIYDAYNENRDAIVIKEEYNFDGTLKGSTEAWEGI